MIFYRLHLSKISFVCLVNNKVSVSHSSELQIILLMKKNSLNRIQRFFQKLRHRYGDWRAGLANFSVDLGSKR